MSSSAASQLSLLHATHGSYSHEGYQLSRPATIETQSSPLIETANQVTNRRYHSRFNVGFLQGAPWKIVDGDPYTSPAALPLVLGLLVYTLTTFSVMAWYLAYNIDKTTRTGVITSLGMGGLLLVMAILAYLEDFRRLLQ